MKAAASTLAFGLLLSVAVPGGAALASDPGEQLLLERANYWRSQGRPDLAGGILNKLLALNPGQPDAVYQLGLLALEQNRSGDARVYFDRLQVLAAANPRAAELMRMRALPLGAAAPAAGTAPAVAPEPAQAAASTPTASPAQGPSLPAAKPPAVAANAPRAARPTFEVASADSDDLLAERAPPAPAPQPPARPVPRPMPVLPTRQVGRFQQVALLTAGTVTDTNTGPIIPPTLASVRKAGSPDLGPVDDQPLRTAEAAPPPPARLEQPRVQLAQLELATPQPIGGYQQPAVRPYLPTDTLAINIDRDLALIAAQSNPTLLASAGFRWHDGSSGLNELTEAGVPIEGTFSPWYTGTVRLSVLPVYLDAGSLDSSSVGLFGANPVSAAAGLSPSTGGDQTATGVGLLAGYTLGDFSGQFGTSPLGFAVTNFVGTAAYSPRFFNDTLTVRFEGTRQSVTDSLLSYAGTHANVTTANLVVPGAFGSNTTWGGVVKNAVHVSAFYDDQTFGAYAGAGIGSLMGENVTANNNVDALLGIYYRPWKTDTWTIRAGVSGYYTGFNKNLSGFTFGQGGYFSPQNYEAVTFPIEYTGHASSWTWLASAALGVAHFNTDSSPFFPKNPLAQATLQNVGATAFYPGAVSTGPAFNVKGQVEYAFDNSWTVGAAVSLDNGNDYNEVIGRLYLRKTFDWFAPVAAKSDPVSIVARDLPMSRL